MTEYYYKCLPKKTYEIGNYTVEAVQPEHIEKIRQWRNEQMDILRQSKPISEEEQIQYYKNHIWQELESKTPKNILLAYILKNELIGYGGLVHLSWTDLTAESSFILNSRVQVNSPDCASYIKTFFLMLKILAFKDLKFLKITSETFNHRKKHIELLEEIGFKKLLISSESNSVFHELLAE